MLINDKCMVTMLQSSNCHKSVYTLYQKCIHLLPSQITIDKRVQITKRFLRYRSVQYYEYFLVIILQYTRLIATVQVLYLGIKLLSNVQVTKNHQFVFINIFKLFWLLDLKNQSFYHTTVFHCRNSHV